MIFQHTVELVLSGRKSQTRRIVKSDKPPCRVGSTIAVQPGRGRPAVARVLVTGLRRERLGDISDEDIRAEGFDRREEFVLTWQAMHGSFEPDLVVWVIEFQLLEPVQARFVAPTGESLTVMGGNSQGGTYVLGIRVSKPATMSFGGFNRGKKIRVPAGFYTYVGSARAEQGATCLARRLVRHASRTEGKQPQPIRDLLLRTFGELGLGPANLTSSDKTLRWNVDHLLDQPFAELTDIIAIRSPRHLEFGIASLLEELPETSVIEPGLGAGDNRGHTHLMRVDADEGFWRRLPGLLQPILKGECPTLV